MYIISYKLINIYFTWDWRMNLLFFILSSAIGGLLIAAAGSYIFIMNLIHHRNEILKECIRLLKEEEFFPKMLDSLQLGRQMESLADEKLDNLVKNFKDKVPMVGVFLVGELEVTLKQIAKEELLSMVPTIEQSVLNNVQKIDFYSKIEQQVIGLNPKRFTGLFVRLGLPSLVIGGILGALFGFILYIFRPN